MRMTTFVRAGCGILLLAALFAVWYSVAANYDHGALAGTYVFHGNVETCILYLQTDRTFVQELSRSGEIRKSQGHWHRYGESHVSFSNEFLRISGEEMNTAGQAHGEFDKRLGIFPILVLAPLPDGPTFHKQLFR